MVVCRRVLSDVHRVVSGSQGAVCLAAVAIPGSVPLLESDLGYLTLGILFVATGLIALLLALVRAASREAAILLFGAMSVCWGIRFLLYTQLVPLLVTGNPQALQSLARGFTYFGGAAAFGFAYALLGSGWHASLRTLALVSLGFALAASTVLVAHSDRNLLLPLFNILVITGVLVVIANTLHPDVRRDPHLRGFVVGSIAAMFFFALENVRALGIAPIPSDLEWIGVLFLYMTLGSLTARRLFANEHRLASIQQELHTAQRIQSSILPEQVPAVSGLSTVVRYLPMTAVAGDIYDFVEIGDSAEGILVADVSGHGVPAALIASMVKGAFRAQIDHIERPERVLAGMNRLLVGQLGETFATASCIYIDVGKRLLRYAGAGHPPLLIQPAGDARCVSLLQNGLVLGQFPEAMYSSIDRSLAPGDRLVLYTDGIVEATNARDEEFGEDSLLRHCEDRKNLSTARFADALIAEVMRWSGVQQGNSLSDDLTLIVVDVDAAAGIQSGR